MDQESRIRKLEQRINPPAQSEGSTCVIVYDPRLSNEEKDRLVEERLKGHDYECVFVIPGFIDNSKNNTEPIYSWTEQPIL